MAYPFSQPQPEYGLAAQGNRFMQQQAQMPFLQGLPGYAGMLRQRSGNTASLLQGQVPTDVLQQIQQRGMERGLSTGVRGDSPNANASWLRALGLTSLGLQQQGSQQLSQSIADVPVPALWNPLDLYLAERKAKQELDVASGAGSKKFGDDFAGSYGVGWFGKSA